MEFITPDSATGGTGAAPEALPRDVRARLIQESYGRTAMTVPVIAAATFLLGGEAWLRTSSPWLLLWLGVSLTISAARILLVRAYRTSTKADLDIWALASDRLSVAA